MVFAHLKSRILFEGITFLLVFVVLLSSTSSTAIAGATQQTALAFSSSSAQQGQQAFCSPYPITLHRSSVENASPQDELMDILSGSQPGNFGWLSWTGVPSSPALATSLTPPGNSVAYINQSDPADSVVSVGDWVSGFPSVTNSSAVNQALDNLIGEIITIPIWEESAEQGNNSVYSVVRFADVELTGYHLPSENRISAIFHGFVHCEAPVANDDFYETNDSLHVAAPGILGNDTDLEGDSLTAVLVSNPAQGFLALNNNGSFDYLPNDGFEGTDSFTYLATDGALDSNVATVVITVDPAVPALNLCQIWWACSEAMLKRPSLLQA